MLLLIVYLVVACILLAIAAHYFVSAASAISINLGVPPLIIGIVLLGLATSLPEMLVSGIAAATGKPLMAVGNALGSNITNIGFVIAVTALIKPVMVNPQILRREFLILFAAMLITWALVIHGQLGLLQAVILISLMLLLLFTSLLIALKNRKSSNPAVSTMEEHQESNMNNLKAGLLLVFGLSLLLASSHLLIYAATHIATILGVSQLVIGITVIALGTSLPELAANIAGILKHKHDLVIGNVIGSNITNILGVFPIAGLFTPTTLPKLILWRDFPIMLIVTLLLVAMIHHRHHLCRLKAGILLAAYFMYQIYLYGAATL